MSVPVIELPYDPTDECPTDRDLKEYAGRRKRLAKKIADNDALKKKSAGAQQLLTRNASGPWAGY
jgi:hypothetical protein